MYGKRRFKHKFKSRKSYGRRHKRRSSGVARSPMRGGFRF